MESADRAGAAALVQKQIEQIEHTEDERERGSMVLVRNAFSARVRRA